jgi:CHRD domain
MRSQVLNPRSEEAQVLPRIRRVVLVAFAIAVALVAGGSPAFAQGGRPFTVTLTGAAEVNAQGVPNQGDPDGIGTATLRVNPGLGRVCWTITVSGVAPVFAAHIHVAPPTAPGPIVVPLNPYTGGCVDVDKALAHEIVRDPGAYYVNVHNADFPAGALRGQLGR